MNEEKFVLIICRIMKVLAWFVLIFGIIASIVASAALAPILMISRWSGVVMLVCFILVFLSMVLVTKIAEILIKIKQKVGG